MCVCVACSLVLTVSCMRRLFGELDPWLKELWDKLLALYPLPPGAEILPEGQLYGTHALCCDLCDHPASILRPPPIPTTEHNSAPPKYTISFADASAAPTSNARRYRSTARHTPGRVSLCGMV